MASSSIYPAIVTFGYKNVQSSSKGRLADCSFCEKKIADGKSSTGNWRRHLKQCHEEKFAEFEKYQQEQEGKARQETLDGILIPLSKYSSRDIRQQRILRSIIRNVIVDCNIQMSIIQHPGFIRFLEDLHPKFNAVSRTTITRKMDEVFQEEFASVQACVKASDVLSITLDIWSDRTMRSFLGVTAHFIAPNKQDSKLFIHSKLIGCRRFTGSHSAARIVDALEQILDEYDIRSKVAYIVTDNASNMRRAFEVVFPQVLSDAESEVTGDEEPEEGSDGDDVGTLSLVEGVTGELEGFGGHTLRKGSRNACFAHTLQLVIGDAIHDTRSIGSAMGKASRMSSLLHSSSLVKDEFEKVFGSKKGIPAVNQTRWNSTFRQVSAIVSLDSKMLSEVYITTGHQEAVLTSKETRQLKELVFVLTSFADATDICQGEKYATITQVAPVISQLHDHLVNNCSGVVYVTRLVTSLLSSLVKRFGGLLANIGLRETNALSEEEPFGDYLYIAAATLDPTVGDEFIKPEKRVEVMNKVKKYISSVHSADVIPASYPVPPAPSFPSSSKVRVSDDEDADGDPLAKIPRLKSYKRRSVIDVSCNSVVREFDMYLEASVLGPTVSALPFWFENRTRYPKLYEVIKVLFSCPSSSAPVERSFSQGGLIMRPHRSSLADKTLSKLVFMKCNMNFGREAQIQE